MLRIALTDLHKLETTTMKTNKHSDAEHFAQSLKKVDLDNKLKIGKFELPAKEGVEVAINYNQSDIDLLENKHEYTLPLLSGDLFVSLQLYENIDHHYRLFCYTNFNGKSGMTFSINLTTEKERNSIIYLTQKLKFSEQYKGSQALAKAHRRQKQIVFSGLLNKLGMEVTDNNELILGIYDPTKKEFANTSAQQFLNDFIAVSILKGHFQGNKGYQLEILPTYNKLDYIFTGRENKIKSLPSKIAKNKSKRNIPLGMRYKVLRIDNFKCVHCGRTTDDGIKLHVDHKVPYSLGGLTELGNLQTLCNQCNLGKSNKYIDK